MKGIKMKELLSVEEITEREKMEAIVI